MRTSTLKHVVIFAPVVAALALCGCPAATSGDPSQNGQDQVDESLVVFSDPNSSLRTNDVYDVDDEIVHFDPAANALVWVATGASFPGYPVNENLIGVTGFFQVRFGTVDGKRRAYFTESAAGTICNITVTNGSLAIFATNVTVPE